MNINLMNFILVLGISLYIYFITKSYYKSQCNGQKLIVILLFLVHFSAMGFAYNSNIVDAVVFYNNASTATSWISLFGLGTSFMSFLIYPLVHVGVSMFVLFFLFATISYQAFLWYFNQMSRHYVSGVTIYGIPFTQLFFLLPSLHYWSGFLGKDVLVFYFLTYLLFENKMKVQFNMSHGIVLVLLLLLRPHIFVVTFGAFFIYYLTQNNLSKTNKIKLLLLAAIVVGVSIPIVFRFINIESFTYKTISEKWNEINSYALHSGSGVNLMESNYLERIWLLLFRPFYYDASTIYQYIISIENSIVLLFFIWGAIYLYTKRKVIVITGDVKLALLIGFSIVLMIACYIYNLGLASRMRLMFFPMFFYALHQLVHSNNSENA
jgi:hypothetical protein